MTNLTELSPVDDNDFGSDDSDTDSDTGAPLDDSTESQITTGSDTTSLSQSSQTESNDSPSKNSRVSFRKVVTITIMAFRFMFWALLDLYRMLTFAKPWKSDVLQGNFGPVFDELETSEIPPSVGTLPDRFPSGS